MPDYSFLSRDWKITVKPVLSVMVVFLVFFVSANNVCAEITIRAGSLLEWVLGSTHRNREPLRPGKFKKFTATAHRDFTEPFLSTPDTHIGDVVIEAGIKPDPKIGYIEFSATGGAKKKFWQKLTDHCQICKNSLTHSVNFKWDKPSGPIPYTVTAKVFDEKGILHDTETWEVPVGELTFEPLPDLPLNPAIPDPPIVEVWPEEGTYRPRVGDDMNFEVRATSDDGIASIEFLLEDSRGFLESIKEKDGFFPSKQFFAYWPSLKVERTWETFGAYNMIAWITTKAGGHREVKWKINVRALNQPPIPINPEGLTNLGFLVVDGTPGRIEVSEHFRDLEGGDLYFDEVRVNPATLNIVKLRLLGNKSVIEIEPINPGRVVFSAIVREPDGLLTKQSFVILVVGKQQHAPVAVGTEAPLQNQGPEAVDTISTQTLTVAANEVPTPRPTPQGLSVGDSIIVQNTIDLGLHIRSEARVSDQNPDNRRGKAFDGATGTIVNGTDPDAVGRTWWEVKWDASNKVQWRGQPPANRRGWSVEAIGALGLLARRVPETEPQPFDNDVPTEFDVPVIDDTIDDPVDTSNQRPKVSTQMLPQNFRVGASPKWRNLSSYFRDPDGDTLTYTAISRNDNIVEAVIVGNSVKITPGDPGTTEVILIARDTGGLTATQSFRVEVQPKLETIPSLPVCRRTPQVLAEIMKRTRDSNCVNVTEDELESITRLSIINKGLITLKQGDFDELRNLEELVLNENSLSTLPEDVFWYLGELEELSLRDNQFTTLVEDTFAHLDSLIYLTLQGNQLTTLQQGAFDDLDALIELDLRDNQLTTLPAGVFKNLSNLEELSLEDNQIAILSRDVFSGLLSLEYLLLEGNPLQTIEAGAFNGLSNLTDLDFNECPLQTIEAGAFNGLSNLTELDLNYAQLGRLPRDAFSGLSSLEYLLLEGNPLQTIEVGAFNGLSNLTDLNLNDGQLSRLSRDVFSGLSSLKGLDLDGNSLREIEEGAFNGLSNLISLDLDENQLAKLPVGIFSGLSRLERLNLQDNPGAPFSLTLELIRTDNTNRNSAGPATVKVKLVEGAPFDMRIPLSVEKGTLSGNTATLTAGQTESDPITVRQNGTNDTTVRLGTAPTIPSGYRGIQMAVRGPLVLFSDQSNRPPVAVGTIPEQTLTVGAPVAVDISAYFADINKDNLTYTVSSSDPNIATARVSGAQVTLTPHRRGRATVTVKATDPDGLEARQRISVIVSTTEVPRPELSAETWMPDANLRAAVRKALGLAPGDVLTQEAIQGLIFLEASAPLDAAPSEKIRDLTGLEHAMQLAVLSLRHNEVVDVSVVSGLTQLILLDIRGNKVVDVSPLLDLTQLTELSLDGNPITNLAPLRRLKAENPDVKIDIDITVEIPFVSEETWMPDANLRAAVREALGLAPGDVLTQEAMQGLTELDASAAWRAEASEKISDLTGLEHATQLTSLYLRYNDISDISGLSGLTQLTSLYLGWNDISDISGLSGLTQLTSLYLVNNEIIDISPLSDLSQLTWLFLTDNQISDISPLSGLTQLTTLKIPYNQISDVSPLSGMSQLTELYLTDNQISNIDPLSGMGQLTELDLWDNQISDISPLSGMTQLTWLDLRVNEISDISPLLGMTQLTWLFLTDNQISDVSALEGLVKLDFLYLEENPISDFAPLRRLKAKSPDVEIDIDISVKVPAVSEEIWMPDANLRAAVREALGLEPNDVLTREAMQDLTELDASRLGFLASDRINNLTGLEYATQLAKLNLSYNDIIDVNVLSGLNQLRELDLSRNKISDVSSLSGLSQLTLLYLSGNDIIDVSVLSGLSQLADLDLSYNDIIDVSVLSGLTQLMDLDLSYNDIVDVSVLSGLTQLWRLYLDGNEIVDVSSLSGLSQLMWLDLGENDIIDVSVLSGLTELAVLHFEHNDIMDVSVLEGLINLEYLYLEENPISDFAPLRRLKAKNPDVKIDIDLAVEVPAVSEEIWMPDANLRTRVREALNLAEGDVLTQEAIQRLTKLDTSLPWDAPASEKVSDLTGLEHATQLTWLDLRINEIIDISPLSGLSQLTRLYLYGNEIIDVSPLSGLTQLTGLYLMGNEISDISVLSGLSQLTSLLLGDNEISDISVLSGLSQLTELGLNGNDISDVSPLSGLSQLTSLGLYGNEIIDISVLSGLSQLTGLYLNGNEISDISVLSGLSQLTGLGLGGNEISDISPLSGLSQLTGLVLNGNEISDISPLSGLSQLTGLVLNGNEISDISPLSGLSQLTRLYLGYNEIIDVSPLSGLSQLTELGLRSNEIIDVSPLSGLSQLTELGLRSNELIDISPLSGLSQLTSLDLSGNEIIDVSALEGLVKLDSLYLEENPIADVAPLRRLKAKNPDVEIDIDINVDAPAAPAAPTLSVETALLPNYPNPFNPETWIPYQLAKPADITLSIYSVDGRLVRTLALGHQIAGIYQSKSRAAYWDGRNDVGERVASGVYFYTFTAGDFTATRKMLIRK